MPPNRRVTQLLASEDWFAFYLMERDPYYSLVRLVCWQLEEDLQGGDQEVVGMVANAVGGKVVRAPDADGFHMYVHEDDVESGLLRPIIGRQREIYGPKL